MKNTKPTEGELEILNVIWEKQTATVREVHEVLEKQKTSGYTTTLKLMQIMYEKNLLQREASGKTHIYKAAIDKEAVQGQFVQRMIDNVFSGSAAQMVMQALGNHSTSAEELDEIRKYLKSL